MAKQKIEKKVEEELELEDSFAQKFLGKFLNDNKKDLYLGDEIVYNVSMGSLILDSEMGGGLHPGVHRFCGYNEGGKTSQALQVMGNALVSEPNTMGVLIKAEGRLSKSMRDRTNIKFVTDPKDWIPGTCYVLDTNIYETVGDFIEGLINENPDKIKYFIVLDSLDGLILRADAAKKFDADGKVAGVPLLTSRLMTRTSLPIGKYGHILILISQVRQAITIDKYAAGPVRQTSASGGNAALHFADWIVQFEPRFNGDVILEDPSAKPDRVKNKILGHWAKVTIKKSPNESTNVKIQYPIKYGRKHGTSIWVEYEIVELLIAWDLLVAAGSWLTFSEELVREMKEKGLELIPKIQGAAKTRIYLEENPDIAKYLYGRLQELVK